MKKYALVATILSVVGVLCSNMIASWWMLNQPKTPSILNK